MRRTLRSSPIMSIPLHKLRPMALEHIAKLGSCYLVSRFRSSHHCAAHSFANFGIKGTLAIYASGAVFGFEVPTQTRGYNDRNFKSTALVQLLPVEVIAQTALASESARRNERQ